MNIRNRLSGEEGQSGDGAMYREQTVCNAVVPMLEAWAFLEENESNKPLQVAA